MYHFLNKFFTKGEPERHGAFGMTPSVSALFSPRSRVYYVFGLKCLVPVPLWLVRNAGKQLIISITSETRYAKYSSGKSLDS
jgi:hypothetical protein